MSKTTPKASTERAFFSFRPHSLSAKLILTNVCVFIFFLLIIACIMYLPMRKTVIAQERDVQQSILNDLAGTLDANLSNALNLTSVLYYNSQYVSQMMADYEAGVNTLENYFLSIANVSDYIFSIKLCTPENSYYVHQNTRRYTVHPDATDSYDYWARLLNDSAGRPRIVNISKGNLKSTGNRYVTIGRMLHTKDGQELGILLLDVDIQGPFNRFTGAFLDNPYVSRPEDSCGCFLLVNEKNDVLYQSDPVTDAFLENLSVSSVRGEYRDDSGRYILLSAPVASLGWSAYYYIPYTVLLQDLSVLTKNIVAATFVAALLCLGVIILLSRNISLRIRNLARRVSDFKRTKEPSFMLDHDNDEISDLTRDFNDMTLEIDNLIRQVYLLQIRQQEAAYKALKAQIDPHFINNTLQNIQMMSVLHREPEIADAISNLGMLMRSNMDIKTDYITIEQEVKFLQAYVALMQLRFSNPLHFTVEASPDTLKLSILRFMLQPIVENAIKHGVSSLHTPSQITLSIKEDAGDLSICIRDNGLGMAQDMLERLRLQISAQELPGTKHIGLQNVYARIRLAYGPKYGFTIESAINEGTVVTMRLPLRP